MVVVTGKAEAFIVVFGREAEGIFFRHVAFHGGDVAVGVVLVGCAAEAFGVEEGDDVFAEVVGVVEGFANVTFTRPQGEGEGACGDGFGGVPPVVFRDVQGSFVRRVDFGNLHVSMIDVAQAFRQAGRTCVRACFGRKTGLVPDGAALLKW